MTSYLTPLERRLRRSVILVGIGLAAEFVSLLWNHPTAFFLFLGVGARCRTRRRTTGVSDCGFTGRQMNLTTTYLGMRLPNPLIVGAGPLADDANTARELEDNGAAALVLRSLFEEEITGEQMSAFFSSESHGESFAEDERPSFLKGHRLTGGRQVNAAFQTLLALCRSLLRWISSARFRRRLADRARALEAAFSPILFGVAIAIVLSRALKEGVPRPERHTRRRMGRI